jgi:hypothetical protein
MFRGTGKSVVCMGFRIQGRDSSEGFTGAKSRFGRVDVESAVVVSIRERKNRKERTYTHQTATHNPVPRADPPRTR